MKKPANFFERVYAVTRLIPKGKVATYGQIAALLEHPRAARTVGWALNGLPDKLEPRVPWHRVINAQGRISNSGGRQGGAEEQLRRLKKEGVKFDKTGRCDLRKYLWEPLAEGYQRITIAD
ncbi:MAG: MGMT family protein [Chloroflexi bacterium]|nr:MGMT family protein [Chloroflexota bacterium]